MSLHLIKKIHEAPLPTLRGTEQVSLLEGGGIEVSTRREVLPYAPDAWYVHESVKVGYEISFARYFCNPTTIRPLEENRGDILVIEKETERTGLGSWGCGSSMNKNCANALFRDIMVKCRN